MSLSPLEARIELLRILERIISSPGRIGPEGEKVLEVLWKEYENLLTEKPIKEST